MSREFDARTPLAEHRLATRARELSLAADAVTSSLPGAATIRVSRVNVLTGSAAVTEASGFAAAQPGTFVDTAIDYLATASTALGLEPGQRPLFVANPTS